MTKTLSPAVGVFVAVAISLAVCVPALSVYGAEIRDTSLVRSRGEAAQTPTPAPQTPSPTPSINIFTSGGGGISNTISGDADSGGNSGGTVTTGDEEVDVFVVNIGPTNSNTVVTGEEEDEEDVSAPRGQRTR
jgi:hypothetical protein